MTDNSQISKRIARNTLFMFARMLLVTVVGLYVSRIVLQVLGVSDFGIYNVVGGVVVFFSFLQQALNSATYRFLTFSQGQGAPSGQNKVFCMSFNVHLLVALAILALSESIGLFLLNHYLVIPQERMLAANVAYQFSILSFVINVIRTPYNSSILAHERMDFYAYTSVFEALLKLLIVYLLYWVQVDKLIVYALLLSVVDIFLYLWYYLYCRKSFVECTLHRIWEKTMFSKMLKYSGWSLVVNATDVSVSQCLVFFFNVFFGVVANAAFGIANQVTGKVGMLVVNFTQAFNPQIIKSYARNDRSYFLNLIYSTSKLSYYLMFIVCVPLLFNIDFVLNLWLVEVPENTATFIFYIFLFALVDAYSAPLWTAAHATGNIKNHQLIMSSIKIMCIPLAYLLFKHGCDAWTALSLKAGLNVICSIVRPLYMKRLISLPLKVYCRSVFLPVSLVTVLSLPFPLYLTTLFEDGWVKLFVTSAASVIVTLCVMMIGGLSAKERNMALQMLHIRHRRNT